MTTESDAAAIAALLDSEFDPPSPPDLRPFPTLPAPPEDPGEYLTHFRCGIGGAKFDKFGNLELTVSVLPEDKYMALPLTDIRGRVFSMSVFTPHGKTPLVEAGVLGVYAARERVVSRAEDRAWRRVRRQYFEGTPDD